MQCGNSEPQENGFPVMQNDYKALLKERLDSLEDYPSDRFAGTGIVICAGGPGVFTNAYVLIHLLRVIHRCTLPIEVWHFGRAEMSTRMRLLLRELGVDTVDADAALAARPAAIESGWQLKAYALMWSRFEDVLLLDADQVPLRDPAELFDWQCYRQSGAVLWPDIVDILAVNPVWQICDLQPRAVSAIESGQMLIDKRRHWASLQIALHFNEHASHYYRLLYGDKDTYLFALLLSGESYDIVPYRPFSDVPFCLYQRDLEGTPLFQHRTDAKWRYSGAQDELPGFALFAECIQALEKLRSLWNGLVFALPSRSLRSRNAEDRLAADGGVDFVRPGEPPVRLALLPGGDIGAGRAADRMNWHCEEIAGEIELVIWNAFRPIWRFKEAANSQWVGRGEEASCEAYLAEQTSGSLPTQRQPQTLAEELLAAAGFPSSAWMDNRAELVRALRMIATIEPQIGEALIAAAQRAAPLSELQRRTIDAIVHELRSVPRNEQIATRRPESGSYTTDIDFKI
jgi:hypothetical protein